MMKFLSSLIVSCLLLVGMAHAEVAVIVSLDNKNTYTIMDKELIGRIFLSKVTRFPDGTIVHPVNLAQGDDIREAFNRDYLAKTESQLSRYWSRLRFSGKASLPREVSSVEEMKVLIANDSTLIGYIDSMDVDDRIKVVHKY
jgi:hypothetical protein